MSKYIFITGGVVSSLGKGVVSASIGQLLRGCGQRVSFLKFDPYLNRDAGTINPYEHGEVYVTEDGGETDLDLGHYERFADVTLGKRSDVTTGQIYGAVLERERRGGYNGSTVQVIPHVVDAIKNAIRDASRGDVDVTLVELGGTIGDIEGMPYVEAIRQFMLEKGKGEALLFHLVLLPGLLAGGTELKTKPAQHSCQKLRECGLHMDFLLCRTEGAVSEPARAKLALHTNIRPERVIGVPDVKLIYNVPDKLYEQGVHGMICRLLNLPQRDVDMTPWRKFSDAVAGSTRVARVAAVSEYAGMADAYKSLNEAFLHAAAARGVRVALDWIESESLTGENVAERLAGHDGLVVPGGFGRDGAEGRIAAIKWAREGKAPFIGLGHGLQCAVIEFARNVCGAAGAVSEEWLPEGDDPAKADCWIVKGALRIGSQPCRLEPGTLACSAYGEELIAERHRHQYEVNPDKVRMLEDRGMRISGRNPENGLVEIVELAGGGQWFLGTQAHPEFKSRPLRPHPLFLSFVDAITKQS